MQPLVTEVHALRQQMGAVQVNLESLVRQQVVLTPQVSFLQNGEGLVPKEAVTCSRAHKLINQTNVSSSDRAANLCTCWCSSRLHSWWCYSTWWAPQSPGLMVFPCYGGPQDDKDPLVFLQKCDDFLSLRPLPIVSCTVLRVISEKLWERKSIHGRSFRVPSCHHCYLRTTLTFLKRRFEIGCKGEMSQSETLLFPFKPWSNIGRPRRT